MQHNLEQYMQYVEQTLVASGHDLGRRHPFRSRSRHTRRVLRWAERLCEGRTDVDLEVLYTAVIFHDIGYASESLEEHEKISEQMFRVYAQSNHMEQEFTEKVAACIGIHSEKERMAQPESLTLEQLLLMEADLLDEEGALAICWDGLACGYEGKLSYSEAFARTKEEFAHKAASQPMVTKKAKQLWDEKLAFVQEYIKRMEEDLEEALTGRNPEI